MVQDKSLRAAQERYYAAVLNEGKKTQSIITKQLNSRFDDLGRVPDYTEDDMKDFYFKVTIPTFSGNDKRPKEICVLYQGPTEEIARWRLKYFYRYVFMVSKINPIPIKKEEYDAYMVEWLAYCDAPTCGRGHPIYGDNLAYNQKGKPTCKRCLKEHHVKSKRKPKVSNEG